MAEQLWHFIGFGLSGAQRRGSFLSLQKR